MHGMHALLPVRPHAILYGSVSPDENLSALGEQLAGRYSGTIYWVNHPGATPGDPSGRKTEGIRPLPSRKHPVTLLKYLTAELVFHSHGALGNFEPSRRKTIVNLWHGEPLKKLGGPVLSSILVGSSKLLNRYKAENFHMPQDRCLWAGNPRTDYFFSTSPTAGQLREVGITDPGRFVLWMPTFRAAGSPDGPGSHHAGGGDAPDPRRSKREMEEIGSLLAKSLKARGYQLVIKPHPYDAHPLDIEGVPSVTGADLQRAGLGLYTFLGAAKGLVTDYSSVWVDYLLLDRPVGFVVPDREGYMQRRGTQPDDLWDWLPGELLEDGAAVDRFTRDVETDGKDTRPLREVAVAKLGLNLSRHAARDILDELERRAVSPRLASRG